MYASIAWKLRKHLRFFKSVSGKSSTLERQQKYMMIYPTIYVVLTLPLAASRMWSMAHHGKAASDPVMITAGCLITSCGWMDALMYSLTRNVLGARQATSPASAGYRSHHSGNGGTPGTRSQVSAKNMSRFDVDDFSMLRNHSEWDGDGETTPPGTTTTIVGGGKDIEAQMPVRSPPRQAPRKEQERMHRSKNPFARGGSKRNLNRVPEGDEKELIDLQPEGLGRLQKPRPVARDDAPRRLPPRSPRRISPQPASFYSSRSQSPVSSDETRVASTSTGSGEGKREWDERHTEQRSNPFQVKVERTFDISHDR